MRLLVSLVIVFLNFLSVPVHANTVIEKTPSDVYSKVQILKEEVRLLRAINNLDKEHWQIQENQKNKEPHHVFQKGLEVLAKINRYRIVK